MPRDQLPPIEFDEADDVSGESSPVSRVPQRRHRWRRWAVVGTLVVIALVAASTMRRLSDERDQAKAEAARTHEDLDKERSALGHALQPPVLLGDLGAMFTLPSSPWLTEGAIGILVTSTSADRRYAWIVVDGRGARPRDSYSLQTGTCEEGSDVPVDLGPGSLASGASSPDGHLRLVAGPLSVAVDDSRLWVALRHNGDDLGGIRGPLARPTWIPPGATAC
jgi:hypothetical protein